VTRMAASFGAATWHALLGSHAVAWRVGLALSLKLSRRTAKDGALAALLCCLRSCMLALPSLGACQSFPAQHRAVLCLYRCPHSKSRKCVDRPARGTTHRAQRQRASQALSLGSNQHAAKLNAA
jgi:hypothetical protein